MRLYEFIQQEASINEVYKFKPNQPVVFVGKDGEATTGKVIGPDPQGDEGHVFIQGDARGQKFRISRDKLLDPKTQKPFVDTSAPQSGQEAPVDANNDGKDDTTGKPVSGDLSTSVANPKQVRDFKLACKHLHTNFKLECNILHANFELACNLHANFTLGGPVARSFQIRVQTFAR